MAPKTDAFRKEGPQERAGEAIDRDKPQAQLTTDRVMAEATANPQERLASARVSEMREDPEAALEEASRAAIPEAMKAVESLRLMYEPPAYRSTVLDEASKALATARAKYGALAVTAASKGERQKFSALAEMAESMLQVHHHEDQVPGKLANEVSHHLGLGIRPKRADKLLAVAEDLRTIYLKVNRMPPEMVKEAERVYGRRLDHLRDGRREPLEFVREIEQLAVLVGFEGKGRLVGRAKAESAAVEAVEQALHPLDDEQPVTTQKLVEAALRPFGVTGLFGHLLKRSAKR